VFTHTVNKSEILKILFKKKENCVNVYHKTHNDFASGNTISNDNKDINTNHTKNFNNYIDRPNKFNQNMRGPISSINFDEVPLAPLAPLTSITPPILPENPIKMYDIQTLIDPLSPPTSRPPSYAIAPMVGNPAFYFPTRGLPDDYSYVGNLVETSVLKFKHDEEEHNKNDDKNNYKPSSLLQLMGRQKYSSTYKFDYYVLIPRGEVNTIKVHIKTPKDEELFDGDEVIIPELGGKKYTFRKNRSIWKEYYG